MTRGQGHPFENVDVASLGEKPGLAPGLITPHVPPACPEPVHRLARLWPVLPVAIQGAILAIVAPYEVQTSSTL